MTVPKTLWLTAAGLAATFGANYIPDPKTRSMVRFGGIVAGGLGIILGLDEILTFLNIAPRPKVEDVSSEVIPDINKGAPGAAGIFTGKIEKPLSGAQVERSGIFGNTYPVTIVLESSLTQDLEGSVVLESQEFFSFGGEGEIVFDASRYFVGRGQRVRATVNMPTTGMGIENPFYPPEVLLTLKVNGNITDSVRFNRT